MKEKIIIQNKLDNYITEIIKNIILEYNPTADEENYKKTDIYSILKKYLTNK